MDDQLLEHAPCGYLQIDRGGEIVRINHTLRRWLGHQPRFFEDLLSMGGKIYWQTHLMPLLNMKEEISEINLTMVGTNDVSIPVLINAKKDKDIYSIFVVNITQRKRYEQELLIERRKAEDIAQRLKQVNNDLEQFANTASHDLQSPLRTISGMIDLIEKKKLIKPGSVESNLFSLIKRNANQMRLMVRDLLTYSKEEDVAPEHVQVLIEEVCREAIDLLKEDVEKTQAVFTISEMPILIGSKSQLVRLFQNLFENSIKYRSDAAPVIVVSHHTANDVDHIHVKDNGIGFEMNQATEIFSFMKRLHSADQIPGTGIGLSSCKRIMKHHGGSISAESVPGKGSVFKLEFPRLNTDPPVSN